MKSSVLLIYTGGTIGMIQNPETGSLESFNFENLLMHVPEIRQLNIDVDYRTFMPPIDSSDMDIRHWQEIVKIIADNYCKYDGFVILHGTDTMAFTASALSFMLENLTKPVILTGSQLPIGALRTDGKGNLITSIEIAAAKNDDGTPVVPEVCVFFHDSLFRGNRTSKVDAENFDAFASSNYPKLATSGININFSDDKIHRPDSWYNFTPHFNMESHIVIFSLFPGIQSGIVEDVLKNPNLKGIILRTFGSGNAPHNPELIRTLSDGARNGKVIVNITQCQRGSVNQARYETGLQLLKAGIVSGYDLTVEAALTKMMYLFGRGYTSGEVRQKMLEPIAGEITEPKKHLITI